VTQQRAARGALTRLQLRFEIGRNPYPSAMHGGATAAGDIGAEWRVWRRGVTNKRGSKRRVNAWL
jgi:hypothetical protein